MIRADNPNSMNLTPWREHIEGEQRYRTRVEWGWRRIGSQPPYLSITHETERHECGRWREDSCGAGHDLVLRVFPEFGPLVPFHLCDAETGPLHYLANSVYWWQVGATRARLRPATERLAAWGEVDAVDRIAPLAAFQRTCIQGAVAGDDGFDARRVTEVAVVREWLMRRLPALLDELRRRVESFGLAVRP